MYINVYVFNVQDEGVTFVINGQAYTFRGTLALISGDNLASHYLGGYKSLSSALRKCRHCMAVADDMATEVRLPNSSLRLANTATFDGENFHKCVESHPRKFFSMKFLFAESFLPQCMVSYYTVQCARNSNHNLSLSVYIRSISATHP